MSESWAISGEDASLLFFVAEFPDSPLADDYINKTQDLGVKNIANAFRGKIDPSTLNKAEKAGFDSISAWAKRGKDEEEKERKERISFLESEIPRLQEELERLKKID
jgi:hypothetical protein